MTSYLESEAGLLQAAGLAQLIYAYSSFLIYQSCSNIVPEFNSILLGAHIVGHDVDVLSNPLLKAPTTLTEDYVSQAAPFKQLKKSDEPGSPGCR